MSRRVPQAALLFFPPLIQRVGDEELVRMTLRHDKTMTVPQVRDRLYAMSESYRLPELRQLADQLWRRPPGRRKAPVSSPRITPELREAIRTYALDHPYESEFHIGVRFGVNQGRVSEALFGFREEAHEWSEPEPEPDRELGTVELVEGRTPDGRNWYPKNGVWYPLKEEE